MTANPILTAMPKALDSARQAQLSQPSEICTRREMTPAQLQKALEECEMSLRAPTIDDLQAALSPLLALCAPLGMTANDRMEWIAAAADTLKDVPADLLHRACRAARAVCDHPSKIIPFVMSEIAEVKAMRQERHRDLRRQLNPPVQEEKKWIDPAERKQVARWMAEWREAGYRADFVPKGGWGRR